MTSTFKGHLSQFDRHVAILESTLNRDVTECNVLLERTLAERQLNMANAECKVLCEAGTFGDIESLYEAAGNEVNVKSKGLLIRMVEAIQKFFDKITTRIASLFTRESVKEASKIKDNITVEADPNKLVAIYSSIITKAKGLIAKIKSGGKVSDDEMDSLQSQVDSTIKTGGVVMSVAAAAAGVFQLIRNKEKIKTSYDNIKKDVEKLNLSTEQTTMIKKVLNTISVVTGAMGKKISSVGADISVKIKSAGKAVGGKFRGKKDDTVEESTDDLLGDSIDISLTSDTIEDIIDAADEVSATPDGDEVDDAFDDVGDILTGEETPSPADIPSEDEVEELMELVSFM